MEKNKLIIFFLSFLFSCNNSVLISELEIIEGESFYNGERYSGVALKKDNLDNIRVEEKYNDGIKFYTKLFYSEGSMQSEWIYGNSKISVTRFYKNGRVESKESFDKEMVRNGTSYLYYKNGNLKSEWNFKNGLRDGIQKNFFGDGSVSDETETVQGIQNGFMRIYDRSGELLKEVYFKDGFQVNI
jgi:antitoxin component YwqK of YwqJK toxin-antitoxin module